MSKRLDGTSIFSSINSGFTNTFAQLNGQYSDGITLENLTKALSNPSFANNVTNATFSSYLTNNFNSIDSDNNGVISNKEIEKIMNQMNTQGITREQIISLASNSGLTSLQETVLSHFDEIDKNKDGKITNQEIQQYGVTSNIEKQKISDRNRLVNNMSLFYDTENDYEGSLLDYRYLSDT